jgi:hypothetical protein
MENYDQKAEQKKIMNRKCQREYIKRYKEMKRLFEERYGNGSVEKLLKCEELKIMVK